MLAVLTALTTALLLLAAAGPAAARELRWWAAANLLVCLGVAIGALTALPLFVHGVLGYAVIGGGLGAIYAGFGLFRGRPPTLRPVFGWALAAAAAPLWFAYVDPSVDGRVAAASTVVAMACLACAWRLAARPDPGLQRDGGVAEWITAGALSVFALIVVTQIGVAYLGRSGNAGDLPDLTPVNLLAAVAAQVTVVFGMVLMIEHRRALQMHRLSLTDPLTGLYNRAGLDHVVGRRLARRRHDRREGALAALLFDADHFKRVNDEHGHAAGDAVLAQLAQRAAATLRPDDVLARYGGEEFVAVLFDVDAEAARQVAERLRAQVHAQPVPLPSVAGAAAGTTAGAVPLTVSVGVAVASTSDEAPALPDLLRAADRALYAAKAGGRNRVELATG